MRKIARRAALALPFAVAFAISASDGEAQTVGQYVDDALITAKLKARISAEFGANLINIETKNGVVRLSGTAETSLAAARAVQLATSIEGVRAVQNQLQHP